MALEAGSVFTNLGARFDDTGFVRWERKLREVKTTADRGVHANLTTRAETTKVEGFHRALKATGAEAPGLAGRLGKLGGAFSHVNVAAAAAGVAVGGAFLAFEGAKKALTSTEELAKGTIRLTAITKMDAEQSSAWLEVAKQRGLQSTQLNMGFIALSRNIRGASEGSKNAVKSFGDLGVSMDTIKHGSTQDVLMAVADGLKGVDSAGQRAALTQALFGRGAQALLPILSQGSGAIQKQLDTAKQYGATIDEQGIKKSRQFAEEQRKLGYATDGIRLKIGEALVPVLGKAANKIADWIKQIRDGHGPAARFADRVKHIADEIWGVVKAFGQAAGGVAGFFAHHPQLVVVAATMAGIAKSVQTIGRIGRLTGLASLLRLGAGSAAAGAAGSGEAAAGGAGAAGLLSRIPGVLKGAAVSAVVGYGLGTWASKAAGFDQANGTMRQGAADFGLQRSASGLAQAWGFINRGGTDDPNHKLNEFGDTIHKLSGRLDALPAGRLRALAEEAQKLGESEAPSDKEAAALKRFGQAANDAADQVDGRLKTAVSGMGGVWQDFDRRLSDSKTNTKNAIHEIRQQVGAGTAYIRQRMDVDSEGGKEALAANFRAAAQAVKVQMQNGTVNTRDGLAEIRRLMVKSLGALGLTPAAASSYLSNSTAGGASSFHAGDPGQPPGHAGGGWIGSRGEAGNDTVPALLGRGEAVLNRHQQAVVEGLLGPGFLDTLFARVQRPHYLATGGKVAKLAGGGYGFNALEGLWTRAGGPTGVEGIAAAIALAESRGNPQAHNASGASGLWQILGNPFPGDVYDPLTNARMAVSKYRSAHGFSPWTTYTSGAYQGFLHGTPAGSGAAMMGGSSSGAQAPLIHRVLTGGAGMLGAIGQRTVDLGRAGANAVISAANAALSGGSAGGGGAGGTGLQPQVLRAIAWARGHGWHGSIISGFRSLAQQQSLWANRANNPNPVAPPGTSMHERGLAVDVSDPTGFGAAMAGAPAGSRLLWFGPGDPSHFSTTGHSKGGFVSFAKGGKAAPKPKPAVSTAKGVPKVVSSHSDAPEQRAATNFASNWKAVGLAVKAKIATTQKKIAAAGKSAAFNRIQGQLSAIDAKVRAGVLSQDAGDRQKRTILEVAVNGGFGVQITAADRLTLMGELRDLGPGKDSMGLDVKLPDGATFPGATADDSFNTVSGMLSDVDLHLAAGDYGDPNSPDAQAAADSAKDTIIQAALQGSYGSLSSEGALQLRAIDYPLTHHTVDTSADTNALLAQTQTVAANLKATVASQSAALSAFGSPGDIGTGGFATAFDAARGAPMINGVRGTPISHGAAGIATGPMVVINQNMLHPGDPATQLAVANAAVAGIGYQPSRDSPRETIGV